MSESIPNSIQHIHLALTCLFLIGQKEINPQKKNEPKHQQPASAHVNIHFWAEKNETKREKEMMRKKHRTLQKSNKCNKQKMSCSPGCMLSFSLARLSIQLEKISSSFCIDHGDLKNLINSIKLQCLCVIVLCCCFLFLVVAVVTSMQLIQEGQYTCNL